MPSCRSCFNKLFKSFDLFPTSNFIRYNGQSDYTTVTGGVMSIGVIVILIVLFLDMGLKTVRQEIITSSVESISQADPSLHTVTIGPQGNFMFAIGLYQLNITQTPRLFDYLLLQQQYTHGFTLVNSTNIPLVQCTQQHFNFSSQILQEFHLQKLSGALCPPIGQQLSMKGKMTGVLTQFKIVVLRCNNTLDPTCANDTVFQTTQTNLGGVFNLMVPIVSAKINPGNSNYKTFYLQDQNIVNFQSILGTYAYAHLSQDIIETDISLMPWQQIVSEAMTRIKQNFITSHFTVRHNFLVEVNFFKSPGYQKFSRGFNKIDAYFSYVGGLVGTIIGVLFIMGPYTEKAFEISLGRKVLVDNDHKELSSRSYNLGYYFLSVIKEWGKFFKIDFEWPKTQKYLDFSQQVAMQIDITYILRKLIFLDAAIAKLMQKHEIDALCLRQKPTIDQAKEFRYQHFSLQIMKEVKFHEGGQLKGGGQNSNKRDSLYNQSIEIVKNKQQILNQDLSAIDFDENQIQIKRLKHSINKVIKNRNSRSNKAILKDIDPEIINQYGVNVSQQSLYKSIDHEYIVVDERSISKNKSSQDSGSKKKEIKQKQRYKKS